LSLFLATAAESQRQQQEAIKKPSSAKKLLPGSMPTIEELRAYGAYKRLHGLNFDDDPKAEAKALHTWFKILWAGGSSSNSSSTSSGSTNGKDNALPRRMKPQLAETASTTSSDESDNLPLVGNAPNSPVSSLHTNILFFVRNGTTY